jgi:putative membrane protein
MNQVGEGVVVMQHTRVALMVLAGASLAIAQSQTQPDKARNPQSDPSRASDRSRTDSTNPSASTKGLSASEESFVREALEGGHHEVDLAKTAVKKASDPKVKAFAQRLVKDHTAANHKLETIAHAANTPTGHAEDSDLTSLNGTEFDKAYVKKMVDAHQMAIAKFESAEKDATNPDLKKFISSTLPTLREHLKQAQSLDK